MEGINRKVNQNQNKSCRGTRAGKSVKQRQAKNQDSCNGGDIILRRIKKGKNTKKYKPQWGKMQKFLDCLAIECANTHAVYQPDKKTQSSEQVKEDFETKQVSDDHQPDKRTQSNEQAKKNFETRQVFDDQKDVLNKYKHGNDDCSLIVAGTYRKVNSSNDMSYFDEKAGKPYRGTRAGKKTKENEQAIVMATFLWSLVNMSD